MSQNVLIVALICPNCKKEKRLSAQDVGNWIVGKGYDCLECGPQPRPVELSIADIDAEVIIQQGHLAVGINIKNVVRLAPPEKVTQPAEPRLASDDQLDVEEARRVLAKAKAKGEKPITWEEGKKELGL